MRNVLNAPFCFAHAFKFAKNTTMMQIIFKEKVNRYQNSEWMVKKFMNHILGKKSLEKGAQNFFTNFFGSSSLETHKNKFEISIIFSFF